MKKLEKLSLKEYNRLIGYKNSDKSRKKPTKATKSNKKTKRNKNNSITQIIELPEIFDLHKNTDESLEIMGKFRKIVDNDNPKLKSLSFDKMQRINSSSALMLAAEIDVWNKKTLQKLHAQHKTWNTEIKALLCEMGFFELLGIDRPPSNDTINKNTTFLQFTSGHKVEGSKAKELREKIESTIGTILENKMHLYEGLTEAFTNTKQHAYNPNPKPFDKWWTTAAYKKDDNKLIVSMYDRGKSIPKTIHKYKKWGDIQSYLSADLLKDDAHLIKAAMKVSYEDEGKTRTKHQESHRGKGLKQLLDFIKDNGRLTIISGKGRCVFSIKNEKLVIEEIKSLKYPLQGTLIEWEISLSSN